MPPPCLLHDIGGLEDSYLTLKYLRTQLLINNYKKKELMRRIIHSKGKDVQEE